MKKAAIYIRVSTHYQIDKDSLPLQRNDLVNYSKFVLNINDYEIFEDAGYSGKNIDRPSFKDMMKRVRQGEFSHLLVWKIDRISRNLLDFCDTYEELKKYDVTFISKNEQFDTSSAMGEAMLKIILVFAELERKLTGERVTAVMLDRATKGLWNGAPVPLGYKWNEEIKFPAIDENEKVTIDLIFNMYKEVQSTSIIRDYLNANNIKTKKDGSWTTKTLADIIRNPFYKGTYRYNYRESARGAKKKEEEWILVDDNHPAIISKELWNECNEIMNINANKNNARFRSNSKTHIFAGVLKCGECDATLYAKQDKAHLDGFRPSLYVCSSRYNGLGCNQKTINDNKVGTFVLSLIKNINELNKSITLENLEKSILKGQVFVNVKSIDKSSLELLYKVITTTKENFYQVTLKTDNTFLNIDSEILRKEKEKYKRALSRLEDLYLFDDEAISEKDYILKKKSITDKLKEINKKLSSVPAINNKATNDLLNLVFGLKVIKDKTIDFKSLINSLGRENIKEFINNIINQIKIENKNITQIEFKNGLSIRFNY